VEGVGGLAVVWTVVLVSLAMRVDRAFVHIIYPTYLPHLSTYLPIYLAHLPIYLSTYLPAPIYLSTYPPAPIYLSTYLPIYLSTYLPFPSTYPPIYLAHLPIYTYQHLSTLPIYLSTWWHESSHMVARLGHSSL
jgi:hypothetical protein